MPKCDFNKVVEIWLVTRKLDQFSLDGPQVVQDRGRIEFPVPARIGLVTQKSSLKLFKLELVTWKEKGKSSTFKLVSRS